MAKGIRPQGAEGPAIRSERPSEGRTIEKIVIGEHYDTTYATLWKDGAFFPRGSRVLVTGLHLEQGFCVRFPAERGGEELETWEDWDEADFLAEEGSVESGGSLPSNVMSEAQEVLEEAEDGCHLHLHEAED